MAQKAKGLAEAVLTEGAASGSPALQRSAAEIFAFAACIGSDQFAANLARSVCRDMAETPSTPRRAALAVAAGAIYRSKGGIALQAVVPAAAQTLMAVARGSSASVHLWVLHGLWLTANSAGLAFVPQVRAVRVVPKCAIRVRHSFLSSDSPKASKFWPNSGGLGRI